MLIIGHLPLARTRLHELRSNLILKFSKLNFPLLPQETGLKESNTFDFFDCAEMLEMQ